MSTSTALLEATEDFITNDAHLHHAALKVADTFAVEWDDSTRTYTAGDRAAMVTIVIDDQTSVETGWEWSLRTGADTNSTHSCTSADSARIEHSIVHHLTSH